MRTPYETPTEKCPYCGTECEAEYCDIGVGMQQVTPFVCHNCHAVEIGPYDDRTATEVELQKGWYKGIDHANVGNPCPDNV